MTASPLARFIPSREPLSPAQLRAKYAEAFHDLRIAVLPIDEIRNPADRETVIRICVKEYGEPARGRGA